MLDGMGSVGPGACGGSVGWWVGESNELSLSNKSFSFLSPVLYSPLSLSQIIV